MLFFSSSFSCTFRIYFLFLCLFVWFLLFDSFFSNGRFCVFVGGGGGGGGEGGRGEGGGDWSFLFFQPRLHADISLPFFSFFLSNAMSIFFV